MRTLTVVLIILLIAIGVYYAFFRTNIKNLNPINPQQNNYPNPSGSTQPKTVTFNVSGGNYYFNPSTIRVEEGDTVVINFSNVEGPMHDFVIDEFNVKSKTIAAGEKDTVTFTANKKGTYEYYCSINNHRQMGMKGTLIVEPTK